jgi:hypothetical protein
MAIRLLSVVVLLVLFAFTASAQQIYRWKDKKGQWHFADTAPPGVTAEKVRGLDISPKSSPATSPYAKPSKSPLAGSGSKEKAVSKLPTERTSDTPQTGLASRWLLLLPGRRPWQSFDSAEACMRHREILIKNTVQQVQTRGGSLFSFSPYTGSHCTSSDAIKPSKEANVIVVSTDLGRDLTGRVFNRGQTTAKSVRVKYQVRNTRGKTVSKGSIKTVPSNIEGLMSAEFRRNIQWVSSLSGLSVHTEVDWSKN